jgi:hypothetical protein
LSPEYYINATRMKIIKIDLLDPTTDHFSITSDDLICQIEFFTNSPLTIEEQRLIRKEIPNQFTKGTIYFQFSSLIYKFTFSKKTKTITATLAYGMN